MGVAAGWFVLGIVVLDRIYFYPPILFMIGLITLAKGVMQR